MNEAIEALHRSVLEAAAAKRWATLADANDKLRKALGDALCEAALAGNEAEARELIAFGAEVNFSREKDRMRPVHLAASMGHFGILRLLAESGASLLVRNQIGKEPTDLAKAGGHTACLQYLAQSGLRLERFIECAEKGLVPSMRRMLAAGVDVDCEIEGNRPLLAAARNFKPDAVNLLLDHGAAIDSVDPQNRMTALHYMVGFPSDVLYKTYKPEKKMIAEAAIEAIGKLIARNMDVNAVDNRGDSPLHLACQQLFMSSSGFTESIVFMLVKAGANPYLSNAANKRPIDLLPPHRIDIKQHLIATFEKDTLSDAFINGENDEEAELPTSLSL